MPPAYLSDSRKKSELMKRLDAIKVKTKNNQSQNPFSKINSAGGLTLHSIIKENLEFRLYR